MVFLYGGGVDCNKNNKPTPATSTGGSSTETDYTVSKYLGLELNVTNIKKSGSYSYVYCTIENVSSLYGIPTMYRYIKVKAIFKDIRGNIIDTDWTYAIDSVWLNSGETKTFYFMVNNTNVYSASLSIL